MNSNVKEEIEKYWEEKESLNFSDPDIKKNIFSVLQLLDSGEIRVCEKKNDNWITNEWIKKGILLSFKTQDNVIFSSGISNSRRGQYSWFDKVYLKTSGWVEDEWTKRSFRSVPGAIVRYSAFVAKNVVLMPSFLNLGAFVDSGSMIDTWATVGSCAQVGKNVHISGGAGIGGVLEPLQANPVIIEDNCFIGARSEIAEGVIVKEGSVIFNGRLCWCIHQDCRSRNRRDLFWRNTTIFRCGSWIITRKKPKKWRNRSQFILRSNCKKS